MSIAGALGSIKAAAEALKHLQEISSSMKHVELKSTIAQLANDLVDTQMQLANLKQEMLSLEEENQRLKGKEAKERPMIKWGCYEFYGDDNLYCTACWDRDGRKSVVSRKDSKRRYCPVCQAIMYA